MSASARRFERSFERIFKRHHAPLLSYCRHMLGDQDDAEDALQQTFVRAHRALRDGKGPRELRPWLYAIARNCCLSAIAARRPAASLQDEHVADVVAAERSRTHSPAGLSEQVHRREELRELVAAIGRLPEDQRSALLLAELEDLPHEQIAKIVECPVSKVKALIYQARTALIADRDALGADCRDIREQLAVARGGELRRGPLRRHLKLCTGCREFQLALHAQRQSLAAVLPVIPSAGLAAAILGHCAHTAGAGGLTGAGGLSCAGTTASAGTTGAAAGTTGAAGTTSAAAGTTGAVAGVGAGAGGGTSVGTVLGGGALTKLAVSGAVAAVAAAGAVAVHSHALAASHPRGALQIASADAIHGDARDIAYAEAGQGALADSRSSRAARIGAVSGQTGSTTSAGAGTGDANGGAEASAGMDASGLTGLSPLSASDPLSPALVPPVIAGAPTSAESSTGTAGIGASPGTSAPARRPADTMREQRRALLRKAKIRRAALKRKRHKAEILAKAKHKHKHKQIEPRPAPKPTKPVISPAPAPVAPAPAPSHGDHRKARTSPTSTPSPESSTTGTTNTTNEESTTRSSPGTGTSTGEEETTVKHHRHRKTGTDSKETATSGTGVSTGTGTTVAGE